MQYVIDVFIDLNISHSQQTLKLNKLQPSLNDAIDRSISYTFVIHVAMGRSLSYTLTSYASMLQWAGALAIHLHRMHSRCNRQEPNS